MTRLSDFSYEFFDFAIRGHRDNGPANYITDTIGMNCSPDHSTRFWRTKW